MTFSRSIGSIGNKTTAIATAIAVGLSFNFSAPTRANADVKDLVAGAIIGAIIANGAKKGKAGAKKRKSGGKKKARGPSDAMALNRDQKRLIQEGLAARGFYTQAIDGAMGPGTRRAIRNWQASLGFPVTGVLTGAQINSLIAASPVYSFLPEDDLRWYGAEIARDLDRDEVRRLQAALNALGYDAGPVDGAWGRRTREALALYKVREGLIGGPVPTKRVLARLEGVPYRGIAGETPVIAAGGAGISPKPGLEADAGQGNARLDPASPAALALIESDEEAAVAPASAIHFEVAGMRLGMSEDEFSDIIEEEFEIEFATFSGAKEVFGGNDLFSYGQVSTSVDWPNAGSQQVISIYDETVPEYGAIAMFRTVLLPDTVTQDVFEANVVPGLMEAYGLEGLVGESLVWVGEQAARNAASLNETALVACGTLNLFHVDLETLGPDPVWVSGNGPQLETESLSTVTADCGDVLRVSYAPGQLSFTLWNSNYIKNSVKAAGVDDFVPEIKF